MRLLDGTLNLLTTCRVQNGQIEFNLAVGLYKLEGPGLNRSFEVGAGTPAEIA